MKIGPRFKLVRGLKESYNPNSTHKDAVYFATDTQEILVNGIVFGAGGGKIENIIVDEGNILRVIYTDKTLKDYTFDLNKLLLYASAISDGQVTTKEVGGIATGTKVEDLKEKTISEVLDDMLFPELQPAIISPKASLSFIGDFVNNGIYEVGSPAPKNPDNFITSYYKGTSKVLNQEDVKRAGDIVDFETFIYYESKKPNYTQLIPDYEEFPETIIPGDMNYGYLVHHGEGEVCISSKGNVDTITPNPLPEGYIKADLLHVYGTYPYFCNGDKASTENQESSLPTASTPGTKLPLVKWDTKTIGCKFASEAACERMVFEFPALKEITKVEFLNTISGKWEKINPSEYIVTQMEEPKEIQGKEVIYNQFTTKNEIPKKGALQIRFTLNNI